MTLTPEQLAALKEVAEKATRGPWRAVALLADAENHHVLAGEFSDRHVKASAEDNNGLVAFADLPANTEFIAACNPTTCLELLEEVERLTALIDKSQTCVVCEATLCEPETPPHCEDCILREEHYGYAD
jgi:hypothetical protein